MRHVTADEFAERGIPPEVPKHLVAVVFAFIRANVLFKEFDKAISEYRRLVRRKQKQSVPLYWLDGTEMVVFAELWLAALQVVVEGYERSHKHADALLSDPSIDALLEQRYGESDHRTTLRRFRNTVFHPEFVGHPDAATVLDDREHFIEWAGLLTNAFGRLLGEKVQLLITQFPRGKRR